MRRLVLGAFSYYVFVSWKKRIRFFRGNFIPGRFLDTFSGDYVDLKPERIRAVYHDPSEDLYYVLYETQYTDYYQKFAVKLPGNVKKLDKLTSLVCLECGSSLVSIGDLLFIFH